MIKIGYIFLFLLLRLSSASIATISDEENFFQHRIKSTVASKSSDPLSPLEDLPREVIVNVLAYLDIPALKKADSASWTLRQAAEVLWKDEAKVLAKEWKVHPPFADGAEDHQSKHIAIVLKAAEECYRWVRHVDGYAYLDYFRPLERAASLGSVRAMEKYLNYYIAGASYEDFLNETAQPVLHKIASYLTTVIHYYDQSLNASPTYPPSQYKVAKYLLYKEYLYALYGDHFYSPSIQPSSEYVMRNDLRSARVLLRELKGANCAKVFFIDYLWGEKRLNDLKKAAHLKHRKAMCVFANLLLDGYISGECEVEHAKELYKQAKAHYMLGRIAEDEGDLRQAKYHYDVACQDNHPWAYLYRERLLTTRDEFFRPLDPFHRIDLKKTIEDAFEKTTFGQQSVPCITLNNNIFCE